VSPDGAIFVGRGPELERLRARLARARAGTGAVVALVGEAGIGKTRAALAFAERARDEGAVVAVGSCSEGEWSAPFLPWSQALGSLVRTLGEKSARRAVGPARGTLAWFVPDLTASAPAPVLGASDERLRLHHGVAELLDRASRDAPLVLVIDDLQWADTDSLALLQNIARKAFRSPWLIVLVYREADVDHGRTPLGDVLRALRDGDFERIPLRGLALGEVGEYTRSGAGGPYSDAFVRALFDETVGNPFYVREVLALLADEGALGRAAAGEDVTMRQLRVPRGVRDVVGRRFARLPEPAARVLRVASAIPEPIGHDLLLGVTELGDVTLRDALSIAVGSGLLRANAGERYEPSHAIVRRVIHDGLQPDLRARLHRRIAEASEASGERRPGLEALIAGEYEASAAIAGAELGVAHAVEAAHEAISACAYERAVGFLRRARLMAVQAPLHVRVDALCELALGEARALHAEEAAEATAEALLALDVAETPSEDVAAFLGEVARELKAGGAPPTFWTPLVERGLGLVNGGRTLTWARLSLMDDRYEPLAYGAVNLARALPRDAEAIRRARQDGDEDDYAATLEDAPRTRAEAEQLVRLASGWTRPTARLRALDVAVRELVYRHAAFVDARRHVGTMLRVATRAGAIPGRAESLVHLASCEAALGSIDRAVEAREGARRLATIAFPVNRLAHVSWLGLDAMLAYYVGGDWRSLAEAAARTTADPAARRSPAGHVAAAIASLAYTLAGHAREARSLLGHLSSIFERCDASLSHYGVALGCATTAVWHLGASDLAEKFRALGRGAPGHVGTAPYASRDLNLGRMAVLLEEWDEAREHLARADVLLSRRGLRPLHAIALHDQASAILRSGDEDGAPRARTKLASALRAFRVMGMEPWIVHAHQLLDLPRPAYPDGLTSREVEILAMIGEGRAAEGIAAALGVAGVAARKETARAYAKIGARGRAAAAAYALDHRFT
jgi:DNA-binding CsgD family transcriptional regulator